MKAGRRIATVDERERMALDSMAYGSIGGQSRIGMPVRGKLTIPATPEEPLDLNCFDCVYAWLPHRRLTAPTCEPQIHPDGSDVYAFDEPTSGGALAFVKFSFPSGLSSDGTPMVTWSSVSNSLPTLFAAGGGSTPFPTAIGFNNAGTHAIINVRAGTTGAARGIYAVNLSTGATTKIHSPAGVLDGMVVANDLIYILSGTAVNRPVNRGALALTTSSVTFSAWPSSGTTTSSGLVVASDDAVWFERAELSLDPIVRVTSGGSVTTVVADTTANNPTFQFAPTMQVGLPNGRVRFRDVNNNREYVGEPDGSYAEVFCGDGIAAALFTPDRSTLLVTRNSNTLPHVDSGLPLYELCT